MGEGVGMRNFIRFFWTAHFGIYEAEVSAMFIVFGSVVPASKNYVLDKDIYHSFMVVRSEKLFK